MNGEQTKSAGINWFVVIGGVLFLLAFAGLVQGPDDATNGVLAGLLGAALVAFGLFRQSRRSSHRS